HGLKLECFCGLLTGQPMPCWFVDGFMSGHTIACCHFSDNHCRFERKSLCSRHVNINVKYHTSFFCSAYRNLHTQCKLGCRNT
ncbi:hypothetical protein PAXRUDRAFT_178544, partial [Paxillus rubicundulus Ve08.2h10]